MLLPFSKNQRHTILLFFFTVGFISLCWVLKTLYFIHEIELAPHKKLLLFSSSGLGLLIGGILASGKSKFKLSFAFLLYLIVSFLLYADVLYERYYDSILHIELLSQANQVGDVKDSIATLVYKTDYWYWIDIVLVAMVLVLFYKKKDKEKTPIRSLTALVVGMAFILTAAFYPLKDNFSDQYKVALTGILPAHIHDLSNTISKKVEAEENALQQTGELKEIRKYLKENQIYQKSSPYYGKFNGKNIIMIQAESLNTFPLGLEVKGEEVTPNINKLIKTSHYYPNTYLQIGHGNTSDAEFVANNSVYPMAERGIYKQYPTNDYLSLAKVLKGEGYSTSATHGNKPDFWNRELAYPKQGYQAFYHINHSKLKRDEIIGMGISDESIFKQMVNIYKEDKKPFYSFIVSLTNHRPFEMPKDYQFMNLPDSLTGTPTGNYLQSIRYFDQALGIYIDLLKKENIWDDTIFIVYGDHYGLLPKDKSEVKKLLNVTFEEKSRFNIPLIIHHPKQKTGETHDIVGSQMDIYPTLTSLLGIDRPLVQFGKPLDIERKGYVGFAYETTRYSFYSDDYDYIASHDGIFSSGKCINNETKKPVNVNACQKGYNKVLKDTEISSFLLKNNLLPQVFPQQ
ncbi:LTA synthase family protein [Peribacillus cavernae]|uniref:LTA synthase family protein n=1 Tax=Peribacillus cavernae TaxID=1674310 RepID=A0A433HT08_9BACI|nr:LTA synthase family protein [Peribacillus cavernae]MDQ0218447.1 phosphoglycerol transferase MdoB-like AlkP superfamily enzyme [Peribacillus cavernae]RUQ31447.1 LTA synthase family protein [Peribacillus cavernae]